MKGIHRVAAAVIATMALAACSADPIGPASHSGKPSLFTIGAPESYPCAPAADRGEQGVSESSTYIVAYGELPNGCATPPADTSSIAPVPPTDSSSFKLSFP